MTALPTASTVTSLEQIVQVVPTARCGVAAAAAASRATSSAASPCAMRSRCQPSRGRCCDLHAGLLVVHS